MKEKKTCQIVGKEYFLEEIEKMGLGKFREAFGFPLSLYKYYPNTRKYIAEEKRYRNFSIEALQNNTMFLQDAENFDDCFDCAIDLDWGKFLHNRLIKYCEYFSAKYKSESDNDLVDAIALKFCEIGDIDKIIKVTSSIKDDVQKAYIERFVKLVYIRSVRQNENIFIAICNAVKEEYDEFKKTLSKFKITCFSESPYLNRMWSSSYGNNNRGFCIEYDMDLSKEVFYNIYFGLYPVIYSQERNDILRLSDSCDKSVTIDVLWQMYFNGLLRKSIYWKDQQEWRLIMLDKNIKENPMPFLKIKKVYLGNKMPLKERKKIIAYCRKNGIEYVGLVRDTNSFNLIECNKDCIDCINKKI